MTFTEFSCKKIEKNLSNDVSVAIALRNVMKMFLLCSDIEP